MSDSASIPAGTIKHISISLKAVERAYHRLVWLVADSPADASVVLARVAEQHQSIPLNIGSMLAEHMAPMTTQQRRLQVGTGLSRLVQPSVDHLVFLDHIEVLFEPSLAVGVGRQIETLSRMAKAILVVWPGKLVGRTLHYGAPGHPEHQIFALGSHVTVCIDHDFAVTSSSSSVSSSSGTEHL